jgi:hypothetical protein
MLLGPGPYCSPHALCHGRLIGSGLRFGESASTDGILNCNVRIACCVELLSVEKLCEVDAVAPN